MYRYREIKFRAWDGFNEEMIKPNDVNNNKKDLSWFFSQCEESQRSENDITVMQFTGIKDNNKVDVYDGDILQMFLSDGARLLKVVKWIDEKCAFKIANIKDLKDSKLWDVWNNLSQMFIWDFDMEIIGNIYQNPELLNDVKNK